MVFLSVQLVVCSPYAAVVSRGRQKQNCFPILAFHASTTSSQHAWPSGVLRRRSDGLLTRCLTTSEAPRPVAQCRDFQEEAEDASVSECTWTRSALEALRNALYKFKTYLLTYFHY